MVSEGKVADADLLEDDNKSGPGESPSDDCQMIRSLALSRPASRKTTSYLDPGETSSVS